MKVLFISSGNTLYDIVPFIKAQGESLRNNGVSLEFLTIKGKGIKGYLKNIKVIRQNAKGFDIIHAHYGLLGLLTVLSLTKKPIVLSVMGTDACGNFKGNGKRIFSSYFLMFLSQIAFLFSNRLIVKSEEMLTYIPYKKKTYVIPNGVDFSLFKPKDYHKSREKLKIDKTDKIVLYLADKNKGNKNFKLAMMAVDQMTYPNLKLINPFPITQHEFVLYLNASVVFVLTSYNEGSPNVIKEAMACNCPIVSTDVGDVKDVIKNTKGCFISSFDVKDVAANIENALMFNKRTTGRKDIMHLDSNITANKIIDIYKALL